MSKVHGHSYGAQSTVLFLLNMAFNNNWSGQLTSLVQHLTESIQKTENISPL